MLRPPVCWKRFGCPDLDVCRSPANGFYWLEIPLGPGARPSSAKTAFQMALIGPEMCSGSATGQGLSSLSAEVCREDTLFREGRGRRDEARKERHVCAPQCAHEPLEACRPRGRLGGRDASRL